MEDREQTFWIRTGHNNFAEFMSRVDQIQQLGVKELNESKDDKRVTLLDTRKVFGTLEEVADLYVNDDKKLVLDFTESKAMHVLQAPNANRPMEYIGFRWSYYRSPSRLVKDQDFFYLETMKPFRDARGRRGWAKCSHSVEHPIENSSELEATFYYTIDTTSVPAFILPIVMKARGKNNAALINHYLKLSRVMAFTGRTHGKRLTQQLIQEKRCGACSNRLPMLSSKNKCQFCKSFVCKRCCEIIEKNYLFDGEGKQTSCMVCAETHGTKISSLMDDSDSSASSRSEMSERSRVSSKDVGDTPHRAIFVDDPPEPLILVLGCLDPDGCALLVVSSPCPQILVEPQSMNAPRSWCRVCDMRPVHQPGR
ncbi:hypothetical protein ATCC90586_005363 [Pythium insidiosum]|nr:hypothetical protein ATCC90586_005363 [Pythium insidiosum]